MTDIIMEVGYMKKTSITLLIIVILISGGCSSLDTPQNQGQELPTQGVIETPIQPSDTSAASPESTTTPPLPPLPERENPWADTVWAGRTREGFLQDFDYLMWILEENYPFFGTFLRTSGTDLRERAVLTRAIIANESLQIDSDIFYEIMQTNFFASGEIGGGHFFLWSKTWYHRRAHQNNIFALSEGELRINPSFAAFHEALTNPATVEFYGEEPPMPINELIALLSGGEDIVQTEILVDGKIAYAKIADMRASEMFALVDFYDDIHNYEHLIIDIRGNPGGNDTFVSHVLAPYITEELTIPIYGFIKAGELNVLYGRDHISRRIDVGIADDMPYFNEEDKHQFDAAFKVDIVITPRPLYRADHQPVPRFTGKMWLLTDGGNFSVSDMAAYYSKQSGAITIVGEQSGGASSHISSAITSYLPNSGIVFMYEYVYTTDPEGRSLEEFRTTPHYFNRPGMDALETALALIEEGEY